jgi:hypothetical protein
MPEQWLLDQATQDALAAYINDAADRVLDHLDAHLNENSLTAALGQELMRSAFQFQGTIARFRCRNFSEQAEEPATGADGGIVLQVTNQTGSTEKGVLFQAKKLTADEPARLLTLSLRDAKRLHRQLWKMLEVTVESIALMYTLDRIYVVDAAPLALKTEKQLRAPLKRARLITFGTYLGSWVARCSRGEKDPDLVGKIREARGFVRHALEVDIRTDKPPLLIEGDSTVPELGPFRKVKMPRPSRPHS